jgi:hypothetical protein
MSRISDAVRAGEPWVQEAFDKVRLLHRAYGIAFGQDVVKPVLDDLARFCRAKESTFKPDAREHAVLEGRREVWLRIQRHLEMTPIELLEYMNPEKDPHNAE